MGAAYDDDVNFNAGAAYVIFLETNADVKNVQKLSMSYGGFGAFYYLDASDEFGYDVTALGDLDGDGVDVFAVGAFSDDDSGSHTGAVYVIFLKTDGAAQNVQKISKLHGNFYSFYTLDDNYLLGVAVEGLGDIDGDGVRDLAASATDDDDGGTNAGAVYILFLETTGTVKNAQKISFSYGNVSAFYTLEAYDIFGHSIAYLGDIDGDGVVDIAVGVPGDDDGGGSAGALYMINLQETYCATPSPTVSPMSGYATTTPPRLRASQRMALTPRKCS